MQSIIRGLLRVLFIVVLAFIGVGLIAAFLFFLSIALWGPETPYLVY